MHTVYEKEENLHNINQINYMFSNAHSYFGLCSPSPFYESEFWIKHFFKKKKN